MTDREKVIKGLEYHLKELSFGKACFECPYCGDNPCEIQLIANALTLLKEQEPMAPVYDQLLTQEISRCGKCGYRLVKGNDKYCCRCGKAVKWE